MKLHLDQKKKKALKMDFMACWARHTALNTIENPEAVLFTARCKPPGGICHCKHNLNVQNSPAAKLSTVINLHLAN